MNASEINEMRKQIEMCYLDAGIALGGAVTGDEDAEAQAKLNECIQRAKELDSYIIEVCGLQPGETVVIE